MSLQALRLVAEHAGAASQLLAHSHWQGSLDLGRQTGRQTPKARSLQLGQPPLGATGVFPSQVQPSERSRFEMLLATKEHEMHHRAQLMVYERMLGIVPHLTRRRAANAANAAPDATAAPARS